MDVVMLGLCPNIPDDDGLITIRTALDLRKDKRISAQFLIKLAECGLKENIFGQNLSLYKTIERNYNWYKNGPTI